MVRFIVRQLADGLFGSLGRALVRQNDVAELQVWRFAATHGPDWLDLYFARRHALGLTSTVVQIGANDGLHDDALRPLIEKYRLQGVLIEPQPRPFQRLVQNYQNQPQLRFENAAVGPEPGELELFAFANEHEGEHALDVFTSTSRKLLEQVKRDQGLSSPIVSMRVPVVPLQSILEKHQMQSVQALIIDAEGYEPEIFRSIDFARIQPEMIQFEHVNLTGQQERGCYDLLLKYGYKLNRGRWETLAFCAADNKIIKE